MRRSGGRGDRLAVAAGLFADPPAHRAVARIPVELRRLRPAARAGGGLGQVYARDCGRLVLPTDMVRWWRQSRVAYGLSVALTVTVFALIDIFAVTDVSSAVRYLLALAGR